MSVDRLTRVNELLKREIGDTLFRVLINSTVDMSAITVTRVNTSKDLKHAHVLVSVRGNAGDRNRAMRLLRRSRIEIQKRINTDLVLKRTPVLRFELDTSIAEGDRILDLLESLDLSDNRESYTENNEAECQQQEEDQ